MLTKCVLSLLFCGILLTGTPAQAAQDEAFMAYKEAVSGIDLKNKPDDEEKAANGKVAAKAFIDYIKTVMAQDRKLLAAHIDTTVLVSGKSKKKSTLVKNIDALFNTTVAQCVKQADGDDVIVRNWVEYGVGDGCLWFSFNDENVNDPLIFAVNNSN